MGQRFTRSTFTGGRAKSGDRGLASPVKQSPIPCSESFTVILKIVYKKYMVISLFYVLHLHHKKSIPKI
jgi:hypothetical protein